MRILKSWLSEFVDLDSGAPTSTDATDAAMPACDDALEKIFSRAGIEVAARHENGGDTIFELEVTANRPDLLSHRGVAREISALAGLPRKELAADEELEMTGTYRLAGYPIQILSDRCRRYCGVVMRGVAIADSPEWMSGRMRAMGLNPISNVVDATNYALFELNHPLHAFDLDKLDGEIQVRRARDGENIALLDGTERSLTAEDLVIADSSRPVALAGIMGGSETAVTGETKNLLLEAAWFDPSSVRRTRKRLGISTDSSYRFERGADIEGSIPALKLLVSLIHNTAGGEVDGGIVDVRRGQTEKRTTVIRDRRIRDILGHEVKDWSPMLAKIGVNISGGTAHLPSWRVDLEREIDLIEELARIDGYDKIGSRLPWSHGSTPDFHHCHLDASLYRSLKKSVASAMSAQGFDRCVNFSFDEKEYGDVVIANPINAEANVMRGSLLPSLIRTARFRSDRAGMDSSALFEIDKIFRLSSSGGAEERASIAFLLCGNAEDRRYDGRAQDVVTMDHLLGAVRALASSMRLRADFRHDDHDIQGGLFNDRLTPTLFEDSAAVFFDEKLCGRAGLLRQKNGARPCFGCELDLYELHNLVAGARPPMYSPLPRYPASSRDLAFWISPDVAVSSVVAAARNSGAENLEDCSIFDIFTTKATPETGPGLPGKRKSIAIRLVFRSSERTLTDDEVALAVEKVANRVRAECSGELRVS